MNGNETRIIAVSPTQTALSTFVNTTTACATAAAGVGLWIYEKTIENPLRLFYFVGPIWRNAPPEEICHELTGVPAAWWIENADHAAACRDLLERRFHSFDAGVITSVYFTILAFVVLELLCSCCCIRPILRDIRRATH
jgi:hypothetical protein